MGGGDDALVTYIMSVSELDACRLECPVVLPQYLKQVVTTLRWEERDRALAAHPDQRFRRYVIEGVRNGFSVGCTKEPSGGIRRPPSNMQDRPRVIDDYLAEECSLGRVVGPLDPSMVPQVHTNRFGVIPKGTSGRWRLIVDMSFPPRSSVNNGISEAKCSLSYVGMQEAARGIVTRGRGTLMV